MRMHHDARHADPRRLLGPGRARLAAAARPLQRGRAAGVRRGYLPPWPSSPPLPANNIEGPHSTMPALLWEFCTPSPEGAARPAQLLAATTPTGADNAFDAADELQLPLPRMQSAVPCRLGRAHSQGVLRK
jgi:hypothetical protein